MAMTAWSAKVLRSAICLSVKGLTSVRRITIAPIGICLRNNGVGKYGPSPSLHSSSPGLRRKFLDLCLEIGYVDRLTINDRSGSRYRPNQGSLLSDRNKRAV